MQLLSFEQLPQDDLAQSAVTIGNFDGVHLGHRQLIHRTLASARKNGLTAVVITFNPHPAVYFAPSLAPRLICSYKMREELIAGEGVDALLTLAFDAHLSSLSPEQYFKEILLEKLKAKIVWVGFDFTFGKNREGNPQLMKQFGEKYGAEVNVLEPHKVEGIVVSSTKVREFILERNVSAARKLLGRTHVVAGRVVEGLRKGTTFGFPTINLDVEEGLLPPNGVYSGFAVVEGTRYGAAISIGTRPTLGKFDMAVEAHLLDFNGNIYGSYVRLHFLDFIRGECHFNSINELKSQIALDSAVAREQFDEFVNKEKNA